MGEQMRLWLPARSCRMRWAPIPVVGQGNKVQEWTRQGRERGAADWTQIREEDVGGGKGQGGRVHSKPPQSCDPRGCFLRSIISDSYCYRYTSFQL